MNEPLLIYLIPESLGDVVVEETAGFVASAEYLAAAEDWPPWTTVAVVVVAAAAAVKQTTRRGAKRSVRF